MASASPPSYVAAVTWRERLRDAVERSGRTYSLVAADAGISEVTLSRVLRGVHPRPSFDTIVRIAHAVHENVGWILGEQGFALNSSQRSELRGFIAFLEADILGAESKLDVRAAPNAVRHPSAEVPAPYQALGGRLVYIAKGDSMRDVAIVDGDLLYVAPRGNVRDVGGQIVVARLGGDTFVKQLEVHDGRTRLVSRNERYGAIDVDDDRDRFELIGVVVGRAGAVIMRE
jgi:transcriptional regulator with XRE-family HTH domain